MNDEAAPPSSTFKGREIRWFAFVSTIREWDVYDGWEISPRSWLSISCIRENFENVDQFTATQNRISHFQKYTKLQQHVFTKKDSHMNSNVMWLSHSNFTNIQMRKYPLSRGGRSIKIYEWGVSTYCDITYFSIFQRAEKAKENSHFLSWSLYFPFFS